MNYLEEYENIKYFIIIMSLLCCSEGCCVNFGGNKGNGGAETVAEACRGLGGADAATPNTSCSNLFTK